MLGVELEWMLVGQKLNEGLNLYSEIFTQIGPLSAMVYKFVDIWASKNQFVFESVALFIIFIQAIYFVIITNRRNLLTEKNYISGLIFIFLVHTSFDLIKLSPPLMSNLFILMALNSVFKQIEKREGVGDEVFEAGLFIGIATLFYLPASIFIFWVLFGLIFYTGVNVRQVFMVALAFILPLLFTYLYFYFNDNADAYVNLWLFNLSNKFSFGFSNLRDIFLAFGIPSVLGVFGIIRLFRNPRYNTFQNRAHQLLVIFIPFTFVCFLFSGEFIPISLYFLLIPIIFFISGFFIHSKSLILTEFTFLIFVISIFSIFFLGVKPIFGLDTKAMSQLKLNRSNLENRYQGKKVFVTGYHIEAYKLNPMATGYISWDLAKTDFQKPDNYLSLSNIYNNFNKDMPQVIIDKENVMPKVFNNLPILKSKYNSTEKGIYILK
jgi:hypothetical protein